MRHLVVLIALAPAMLLAQTTRPADDLRIYIMTVGPGAAMYEKFGHNQIWVHDPVAGTDIAYNYGVFDFDQENFIWRFIQGRMLYRCEAVDAALIERAYRAAYPDLPADVPADRWLAIDYIAAERSVWVQELDLDPDQKRALADHLAWNAQAANNQYRYDYYRDNCSTRVRDALDLPGVLGGHLADQLQGETTTTTYRWHTRRLTRTDLPLYAALYAVLGQPVDAPIDAWEEAFLPVKLMERLRTVQVFDAAGIARPLVRREYRLHESELFPDPSAPPRLFWVGAVVLGIVLGTLIAAMGRLSARHATARWLMAVLIGGWSLLAGVGGAIGTWAWFTDHAAGYWNENWLQCNPLSLVLIVAGPWVALKMPRVHGGRWRAFDVAYWTSAAVVGLSVAGVLIQVLPAFDQVNAEVLCLAVPLHAGVLGALLARARLTVSAAPIPAHKSPEAGRA